MVSSDEQKKKEKYATDVDIHITGVVLLNSYAVQGGFFQVLSTYKSNKYDVFRPALTASSAAKSTEGK